MFRSKGQNFLPMVVELQICGKGRRDSGCVLWFRNVGVVPSKMRVPLATVQAPPADPVRLSWFTVKVPPVRLTVWVPDAGRTKSAMLLFPLARHGCPQCGVAIAGVKE